MSGLEKVNEQDWQNALLKLRSIEQEVEKGDRPEDKEYRKIRSALDGVRDRYRHFFNPDGIRRVERSEFIDFLKFENNQHWGMDQAADHRIKADSQKIQEGMLYLIDDDIPIEDRLDDLLGRGKHAIHGVSNNSITALLLLRNPDQYGVWNGPSETALKKLNLWPRRKRKEGMGSFYLRINELLKGLANELELNLWVFDSLVWRAAKLLPDKLEVKQPTHEPTSDIFGWVFVANLKYYRLNEALADGRREFTWTVMSQHQKVIRPDQSCYFWITGNDGGLVARGKVIGEVFVGPDDPEDRKYGGRTAENEETTRVRLKVEELLDGSVTRDVLKLDPILCKHPLITFGQGSQFRLTRFQNGLLEDLIADPDLKRLVLFVDTHSVDTKEDRWPWFQDKSIVGTDWAKGYDDAIGDLRQYSSKPKFHEAVRKALGKQPNTTPGFWILPQLKAGDLVIAKKWTATVQGLGRVETDAYHHTSEPPYDRLNVQWDEQFQEQRPKLLGLSPVRLYYFNEANWLREVLYGEKVQKEGEQSPLSTLEEDHVISPYDVDNVILQGPPGTGKTWLARRMAALLCQQPNLKMKEAQALATKSENGYDLGREKYKDLAAEGRIEFVTFHQSFGYEEFVEGIRPQLSHEGAGTEITYELHAGVFKRMAMLAASESLGEDVNRPSHGDDFDELWEQLHAEAAASDRGLPAQSRRGYLYRIRAGSGENELVILRDFESADQPEGDETFDEPILDKQDLHQKYRYSSSGIYLRMFWKHRDRIGSFRDDPNIKEMREVVREERGTKGVFGATYDLLILGELERVANQSPDQQRDLYSREERQARQMLAQTRLNKKKTLSFRGNEKPYVLILDEINRANISSVLGELITLIEPNKRLGSDEEVTVTLPYSNSTFGVPPNLFIIGTMNTTDRSIALLDTALRRRFKFIELMPDSSVVKRCLAENSELAEITLQVHATLNEQIRRHLNRDHEIGHSYFLNVRSYHDLRDVFVDNVIPLLREHFHAQPKQFAAILGLDQDGEARAIGRPMLIPGKGVENHHHDEYNNGRDDWELDPDFLSDTISEEDLLQFFTYLTKPGSTSDES